MDRGIDGLTERKTDRRERKTEKEDVRKTLI